MSRRSIVLARIGLGAGWGVRHTGRPWAVAMATSLSSAEVTATEAIEAADRRDPTPSARPGGGLTRRSLERARRLAAGHPWGAAVVGLAVVLRVAATIAYRPVLEFHGDSYHYLDNARHLGLDLWHPIGYAVLLRLLSWTGSLYTVSVVQHALGLATGLLIYRWVARRGIGDAWAALAAAPVLLDAWQIVAEHTVLAEALFEFLVVAALVLLLRPAVTRNAALAGGALLAAATLTRTVGLFIAVMAVGYLLVRRSGWRPVVACGAAVSLPLLAYGLAFKTSHGAFGLQGYSGRYLYGETATFAECPKLDLPPAQQAMCPKLPVGMRPGSNSYVWADDSPVWLPKINDPVELSTTAGRFAKTVIWHQPVSYLRYVAGNTLHYFDVGRVQGPRDYTGATWQFPATAQPAPVWHINVATMGFDGGYVHPSITMSLADALRGYQRWGFTPGPALALAVLLGFAGAWVARRSRAAWDLLFLTATAVIVLVATSASSGFDYRYVLPVLLLLPPAAVIGGRELWLWRSRRASTAGRTPAAGRTPVLVGAGCAVVALVTTNAFATNVLPAARLRPGVPQTMGSTAHLPGGLDVRLSGAAVTGVRCAVPATGPLPSVERRLDHPTVEWRFTMHVTVRETGRTSRLVQSWNLATRTADEWTTLWAYAGGGYLHDAVLSPRYPRIDGNVFEWLPLTSATVAYTDPTGAGAAAWRLDPTKPSGTPAAGRSCDPTTFRPPGISAVSG